MKDEVLVDFLSRKIVLCFLAISLAAFVGGGSGWADEYYCEVMSIEGTAHITNDSGAKLLKQGDLLKAGDVIEAEAGSHVDIAFDKEWSNVARVGGSTQVAIKSVFPTGLKLDRGDVFSRLMNLPSGSTFEIQTPTAVAAVRGTVYWTEFLDGKTTVYNYSPSPVEVFNLDSESNIQERVIVMEHQKTEVARLNEPPSPPEKMSEAEIQRAGGFDKGIAASVKDVFDAGREGHAPSVTDMEQKTKERLEALTKDSTVPPPGTDDKRAAGGPGGPGGPGGGDIGGSATGQDTTGGSKLFDSTGAMPMPKAPELPPPPDMPPMPPVTQMDSLQNRIDSAVNTVNQTVATQDFRSTTAPVPPPPPDPCKPTGGSVTGPPPPGC